jgi:hypothetical protein
MIKYIIYENEFVLISLESYNIVDGRYDTFL